KETYIKRARERSDPYLPIVRGSCRSCIMLLQTERQSNGTGLLYGHSLQHQQQHHHHHHHHQPRLMDSPTLARVERALLRHGEGENREGQDIIRARYTQRILPDHLPSAKYLAPHSRSSFQTVDRFFTPVQSLVAILTWSGSPSREIEGDVYKESERKIRPVPADRQRFLPKLHHASANGAPEQRDGPPLRSQPATSAAASPPPPSPSAQTHGLADAR
ncbi:hypothetical protein GWI33_011066, partial [Rhynchophorus ferrugineus]